MVHVYDLQNNSAWLPMKNIAPLANYILSKLLASASTPDHLIEIGPILAMCYKLLNPSMRSIHTGMINMKYVYLSMPEPKYAEMSLPLNCHLFYPI